MRRLVLALLAAAPASALAQTQGAISFTNTSVIDIAQCKGAQSPGLSLGEDLDVTLTWNTQVATSASFTSGGVYKVFVSTAEAAAGNDNSISCNEAKASGGTIDPRQVGEDTYSASSQVEPAQSISMNEITTALGYAPDCNTAHTIYVCVQWYSDALATNRQGFAKGTLSLDVSAPAGPPTIQSVSPGDGNLHVSCSGASDTARYQARVTSQSDPADQHFSSVGSDCDLTISGLKNDQPYDVVIFGLSSSNNPSVASAPMSGTPIPTDDYWHHYDGREKGGCNTAAGAAGLLGALAALATLAALRRRNS